MAPVICLVCGTSGSGKTTLIERLLPELARRGVPVATLKHHRGRIDVDRPGKDTWRHRRAGARATFLVTSGEVVAFMDRPEPFDLNRFPALCPPGVRLLLVEGFKGLTGYPRVEILRAEAPRSVPCSDEIICIASDRTDLTGHTGAAPVVDLDDIPAIAAVMTQALGLPAT